MDDEFVVHVAMMNSYDILVNKMSPNEFLETDFPYFAHNIGRPPSNDDILNLIDYFSDQEDYEKCKELTNLIKVIL